VAALESGRTLWTAVLDAVRLGPADDATARAALALYLSPAFAVVFGALFLRESISVSAVAGLAFIIAGSILAARRADPTPT
jgi:drug/metabolite transporter (DMT)-like permease